MKDTTMHDPYAHYRELTLRGMILGALITVVFTASNVYLGLKVGLTFASSIPAAVISMAVLKMFHTGNILENNMVQTQASAAGTLSSIIFVLPGLLMLGYWQGFPFWLTAFICAAGGILGVVFTIPLRRVMVVNSTLPYPEGVAAAEVLKAGDAEYQASLGEKASDSGAKEIVVGSIVAAVFSFLAQGLRVIADGASYFFRAGNAIFQVPMGFSAALLGAGYLVGIAGGLAILFGVFVSWGVVVPYFSAASPVLEGVDIASYAVDIWRNKVRFIGVGTIGVAAIWTLISLAKPMIEGMKQSVHAFTSGGDNTTVARIERDLSPKTMIALLIGMAIIIAVAISAFVTGSGLLSDTLSGGLVFTLVLVCTLLAVAIGFLVAAACGYMGGLVGSSSSPISGISIISIVIISLVLLVIGKSSGLLESAQGKQFLIALVLFTGSIVLAIASISNDNLQDLKTGYLVNATPWRQQVALIIGCIVGGLVIAPVLEMLYYAYGFTGALPRSDMDASQVLSAPQATLMTTIAQGILSGNLEWNYIFVGVILGLALVFSDLILRKNTRYTLPALAVGMGIYLPPSINMPLIIGAILSYFVKRHVSRLAAKRRANADELQKKVERRATLFAAGLIVGESLMGVLLAFVIVGSVSAGSSEAPLAIHLNDWETTSEWLGLLGFVICAVIFIRRSLKKV